MSDGIRAYGPYKETKVGALRAWEATVAKRTAVAKAEAAETARVTEEEESRTLAAVIYYCLFGVYAPTSDSAPPTTVGPWASELAPTTYESYKGIFKRDLRTDPVMRLRPADVTRDVLEGLRDRLRKKGGRVRSARTVERYMNPVCLALDRCGHRPHRELRALKKAPARKEWLDRADAQDLLARLGDPAHRGAPYLVRAARLALHGICRGELAALDRSCLVPGGVRVETQIATVGGKAERSDTLKRQRRYRVVPLSASLLKELKEIDGRFVPVNPHSLTTAMKRCLAETKWADIGPHDLRRSGAKWMLDAGAKLSDVADILGNDPKTLLTWYDTADKKGKTAAVKAVAV